MTPQGRRVSNPFRYLSGTSPWSGVRDSNPRSRAPEARGLAAGPTPDWWREGDSNPHVPAYEAGELPVLYPATCVSDTGLRTTARRGAITMQTEAIIRGRKEKKPGAVFVPCRERKVGRAAARAPVSDSVDVSALTAYRPDEPGSCISLPPKRRTPLGT